MLRSRHACPDSPASFFVPATARHRGETPMVSEKHIVVGLGELLWDLLAAGKQLGGAPANFAYITSLLGDEGIPSQPLGRGCSRCGSHSSPRRTRGLSTEFIQKDSDHPYRNRQGGRGPYRVSRVLKSPNLSRGIFSLGTPQWQSLAQRAGAICFGSLAQRSETSRATIRKSCIATRPNALGAFSRGG